MRISVELVRVSSDSYQARCLSLPGCQVVGCSPAEARNKMGDAVRGYVASLGAVYPEKVELVPLHEQIGPQSHFEAYAEVARAGQTRTCLA
jgi:hypothetical protein